MIFRTHFQEEIKLQFKAHRIVAILGPRQCGKTTLAKMLFKGGQENYFDLEDPVDLKRLENPKSVLDKCSGLIVIDEIQRIPELFPILRVIHDQDETRQFLLLGSASRDLLRQTSESLAGRIAYVEITPFSLQEVEHRDQLWLQGGFPKSYLVDSETSWQWRKNYVRTFLEQDIPNLGLQIPSANLRRFWFMLSHYHGQIFNAHEIANSLDLTGPTVKRYLDLLAGTFMVRVLQPWFENIAKRQVKSPKIYMKDSGILHYLLDIKTQGDLLKNNKLGASWEGFALENTIQMLQPEQSYFWALHGEGELDLLVPHKGQRLGFEFKFSDAPSLTKSMLVAQKTLQLDKLFVIYPGSKSYSLADRIEVVPLGKHLDIDTRA